MIQTIAIKQLNKKQRNLLKRMLAQVKLKISYYLSLPFIFTLLAIGCKDSDSKGDIGYGSTVFKKQCFACHGRFDGYQSAPGLITLNRYDSITLVQKLRGIKKDSLHQILINNFSEKDVQSVYKYIRFYFEPRY